MPTKLPKAVMAALMLTFDRLRRRGLATSVDPGTGHPARGIRLLRLGRSRRQAAGHHGTRSGNVGGSVGTSVDVGEASGPRQQLRVTVRALEPADRREAWVGASAALEPRPEEQALERAIGALMKGFPERQR